MADRTSDTHNQSTDWSLHVKQWQVSNLSQPDYCKQMGISYNAFVYQRSKLKQLANPKLVQHQFVPVKISASNNENINTPQSIQIKLVAGHVVYLPVSLDINKIVTLIDALRGGNA